MRDAERIAVTVNGSVLEVERGTTVAAAVLMAADRARTSVTGEARAPLCGMGICFECRVTVGGVPHRKSCQMECEPGMDVRTE